MSNASLAGLLGRITGAEGVGGGGGGGGGVVSAMEVRERACYIVSACRSRMCRCDWNILAREAFGDIGIER